MIKKLLIIILVLVLAIAAMLMVVSRREIPEAAETVPAQTQTAEEESQLPWERAGAKQPAEYTWDEYCALTPEMQIHFYNAFTQEDFDAWLAENEPVAQVDVPWDAEGAKNPDAYTWEEYNNLTMDQQALFFNWFENEAAFEAWRAQQVPAESTANAPWDQPGAKQPCDYTWEEYLALSVQDQSMFFNSFGGDKAFAEWMEQAKPVEATEGAEEAPEFVLKGEYTWEEYMALSEPEQTAYFNTFENEAAFNAWMDAVKPAETGAYPWEQPGNKAPEEYTWEEYNNLPADQQVVFFNSLNAQGKFDAWLAENEPG